MKLDPKIYGRHQGTQVGKTRSQRSLTLNYSLAMVGGVKRNLCGGIQGAMVRQHDPERS